MPFSYEQRVKVVKLVKEQHLSYLKVGKTIGASKTVVLGWVKLYEAHGYEALKDRTHKKHSGEFKLKVIQYMHDNHLSCNSTAAKLNVAKTQVQRWERIYYEEGFEALLQERRGKKKNTMDKPRKNALNTRAQNDFISEIQQLRMENEYLKKLNALIQKRIEPESMKKSKSSEN